MHFSLVTSCCNRTSWFLSSSSTQYNSPGKITKIAIREIKALTEEQITALSNIITCSVYAYFDNEEDCPMNAYTGEQVSGVNSAITQAIREPQKFIEEGIQCTLNKVGARGENAEVTLNIKEKENNFVFVLSVQIEGDEKTYSYEGTLKEFEVAEKNNKTLPFKSECE